MKNIIKTISFFTSICILLLSMSCNKITDFLDKPPGVDVNEETIFSSQTEVETFVSGLYRHGIHSMMAINDRSGGPNAIIGHSGSERFSNVCVTDEGEGAVTWGENQNFNRGGINTTNIHYTDVRFYLRWAVIRRANILLERIGEVPGVSQSYIDQIKGESLTIRAMNYFEMLKRYGGVPIIDKRLSTEDIFEYPIGRNSIEEVVNFIVSDCDRAASMLPDSYAPNMKGRVTKGVALIIKAKTLLLAASPLFNRATPYLDLGENNPLICYGNEDPVRWQKAAEAAKAVIDWAPAAGIRLITEFEPDKNYKYMWETHDNPEIILANKFKKDPVARNAYPFISIVFPGAFGSSAYGTTITFNFVRKYEKKDGTPQTWDMDGGDDITEKYAELDNRFAQSIAFNGAYWNAELPTVNLYEGHPHAKNCLGGHWQRKLVPDALRVTSTTPRVAIPHNYLYRLADAYLMYAEALNEVSGAPGSAAYEAVNLIRNRSGMPNLPPSLNKSDFRERVRNERTIELAFEDNRLWDVTRWMIAEEEGVMRGKMWGLKITKSTSGQFSYRPEVFEERVFPRRMYLYCFVQNEVNKGYLIQNPGW